LASSCFFAVFVAALSEVWPLTALLGEAASYPSWSATSMREKGLL